jgi:hypothetical protein
LHRTAFTQSNFYTENFGAEKKHRLHEEVFAHPQFYMQKLYPEQLLHTETFPHRRLYAQKSLCTAVFTQTFLFTDAFTYTDKLLQSEICAQQAFTHSQLLHKEALLPLLDHLPLVFRLSSFPKPSSLSTISGLYSFIFLIHCSQFGLRSVRVRSNTFQISKKKNPRSSYLIVVSPRGSNETKETVGMNGVSYQGNDDFAG